jgi:hypothetical protein
MTSPITPEQARPDQFIVCAACRLPGDEVIFCGPRHFDETIRKQIDAARMMHLARDMEQGFIDQYGNFLTREEAMQITKRTGQIVHLSRQAGITDELYSEGLY